MRQSYNSKVNSFLCCSSIFVVTKMLPKVAIQKLIQPYSAGSFPIFVLQTNFPNWKDKTSSVSWLLLFAVSMFVGIFKSKKKNCLNSYYRPNGQDGTYSVILISRFLFLCVLVVPCALWWGQGSLFFKKWSFPI